MSDKPADDLSRVRIQLDLAAMDVLPRSASASPIEIHVASEGIRHV